MKPAILYAAKSTADIKASIPNQLREGRDFAEAEGLTICGKFKDEKKSAYTRDRGPGLLAARAEAERLAAEHGECHMVIQHSDRLARGDGKQAAHLVEYALWGLKSSVKIRSLQDPETFEHEDLIYAVLTGHRNHEDSKRKSSATKAGLRERRKEGKWGGGPRPFGYEYDKAAELLIPLPAEVAIVRRIFDEFLAGASLSAIARELEADRVPTRRGRHWRSATISQILENPVYIGKMRHFDEVHDGTQEAVLDEDDWEQAQTMLRSRKRKGRGRPPKGHHLLRGGLLRCECGGTMICRTDFRPARQKAYEVYVCERRFGRLGDCSAPLIPRPIIDSAVFAYFAQVGLDIEATKEQIAGAREQKLGEVKGLEDQARGEQRRTEERLARVRRDYMDGNLSADDWAEFRDELEGEKAAAAAEVERLEDRRAEVEAWEGLQDVEHDTLAMLTDIQEAIASTTDEDRTAADAVRAALIRLFERFELHAVEPGQRIHADLAWQGELAIHPIVREQVVEGYTSLRPIFRRVPLYDAEKNQRFAHASRLRRKLDPDHGRYVVNVWGVGYRLVEG